MVGKMPNVTWPKGSLCGNREGMAIGVVLHHRAMRRQLGDGPRVPILRLTSWEQKGLLWGESAELTGLINCIKGMRDKNIKLVNMIQVMLIRRILPCQEQAFNLWEFDPEQHQALSGLFDTTYEGAWRVLFKGAEAPASATEDRGFHSQHPADEVSDSTPLWDTCGK